MTWPGSVNLVASINALVRDYDEKWCALDFVGLSDLWERDSPHPVYIGDEYAVPLIGADDLDRHWARLASRLKRAAVSTQLRSADPLAGGLARCILLSRWSFTAIESDVMHTGASWITWLLVARTSARGENYRICHHMESQVHLEEGFA